MENVFEFTKIRIKNHDLVKTFDFTSSGQIILVKVRKKTLDFYKRAFGLEVDFLHESKQYGKQVTGDTKLSFVGHEVASSRGFEYEKCV